MDKIQNFLSYSLYPAFESYQRAHFVYMSYFVLRCAFDPVFKATIVNVITIIQITQYTYFWVENFMPTFYLINLRCVGFLF